MASLYGLESLIEYISGLIGLITEENLILSISV